MDQNQKKDKGLESMFSDWMNITGDFWKNMVKPETFSQFESFGTSSKNPAYKAQKTWESTSKLLQSLFSTLSKGENIESLFSGIDVMPGFMMNMAQEIWDSSFELNKRWVDKAVKLGQHTKAYNFEDMDKEIFNTWREIYEKEIQKILNAPTLGLTRFHQERVNRLIDKHSLFQSALAEFIYMFYVPIEKSASVMQEKIDEMVEKDELCDDFKDYYNIWVKVLEGHYMTLLQSEDYATVMNKTIAALVEYRNAKDEMLYDVLKNLPIPTNKDMDELYKDIYILKKKVRELTKELKMKNKK
ncbi:polyhydroxyalkanoate synthase subunit PhaE [Candidatus Magnetomoraceae bacterium gMMP-15]